VTPTRGTSKRRFKLVLAIALSIASTASQHAAHAQHRHHSEAAKTSDCTEATLRCATKTTPALAPDGSLWLAFNAGNRVLVAQSFDGGKTFPVHVILAEPNSEVDWGPDARPKIAIDASGRIVVAFAVFKDKHFNGQVFHVVSSDGGKTFSRPEPITDIQESQRFEELAFDPSGRLFATWLDKRNRVPARQRGERYMGAALAFAWADGRGIGSTQIVADNTCECCRIAVAFGHDGQPVVLFRNIFSGGIRDHAIVSFTAATTPGTIRRVSNDDWKTDACPHHGPALAIGSAGTRHVAWYTNGSVRKGLFYANATDGEASFSEPMPIGASARNPSRPALATVGKKVHLVWKEFDGKVTTIAHMLSADGGRNWTAAQVVAKTAADSDHPLLLTQGSSVYLSWMTQDEGYRLVLIGSGA